jgi:hypothetical protein
MSIKPFWERPLPFMLLLIAAAGCESGSPDLAPARGRILFRDIPLHTGTIVFTPDSLRGTTGPSARGNIRPDGTYVLETDDKAGAVPGWHRVTIVAMDSAFSSGSGGQFVVPRSLLPDKYRDPEQSGLVCEIKAGQENCIDFNLD